ncbi:hypothetical protein [Halomontanus rarus]|uniref:hypothetical protein n=1 Tax=Halomontanus rarus TaxID=3034020 RepID=UPI0023E8458B|nr:hypothetical protein [Halovivax sp. TS33]
MIDDLTYRRFSQYLTILITISVGYRLFPYLFYSGIIGLDPHWYAVQISTVIDGGTTADIASPYYREAAGYIVYLAVILEILGLEPVDAGLVVAIFVGILPPLVGSVVVLQLTGRRWYPALVTAGILVVIQPLVRYSLWPIAQSLAILLFIVLFSVVLKLLSLENVHDDRVKPMTLLLFVLIIALALVHKFPVFIVALLLVCIAVASKLRIISNPAISSKLLGFIGIVLLSVWVLMTEFAANVILMTSELIFGGITVYSAPLEPAAATREKTGLVYILGRNLHWMALVIVSGVSWLAHIYNLHYQRYSERSKSALVFLLISSSLLMVILGASVIGGAVINPTRVVLLSALVLPILIGSSITYLGENRSITVAIVICLVVTQGIAFGTLPDDDTSARSFLNNGELEGKEFMNEYSPKPIYTDTYYAKAVSDPSNPNPWFMHSPNSQYQSYDQAVFNGSFSPLNPDRVAYRTKVDVYGHVPFGGYWSLDWKPRAELTTCAHRTYSNPNVEFYNTTPCEFE